MQGHIYRRSRHSWGIVADLPRDANGKRRQKTLTVRGTKKNAEARLAEMLHELNIGTFVEPAKMSVAEYLTRWLAEYAAQNVSRKTYERYDEIVRLHLSPALGTHRLTGLKPLHIQEHYGAALRGGRRDGKGGLSAQTVLHHHRVLREALQQAVRWQLVARNPADAVEPPRSARREMHVLDEEQTAKLLESAKGSRLFIVIFLAVVTGLRRGEILALRWEDVDLERALLQVRRTLEQARGGLRFKEPKTEKGRRLVALGPETVETLRRHRREQIKERLALGQEYKNSDLVCARIHGTPLDPAEVTAGFARLIRSMDLPRVRLHDLRHGHATHLLRLGIHPKVVSERLGHSGVAITLNTYSHILPGMQEDAAIRLDHALKKARPVK
jgi:integrase